MEDKSFSGYLTNKLILIISVIPSLFWVVTYLTTNSFYKSLMYSFGLLSLMLLFALHRRFKEHNLLIKKHKELSKEFLALSDEKKEIDNRFNLQSKKYQENIRELNLHKRLSYMIETLVQAEEPKSNEGKKIINHLRIGIEKIVKEGDQHDI